MSTAAPPEQAKGDLPNRRCRRASRQRRHARASWLLAEHDRRREAFEPFESRQPF